jgi:DNA-binding NarL/FixJ family response regulator
MNVLLVDDHELFRKGLVHLLQGLDGDGALRFHEAEAVSEDLDRFGSVDLVLLDMHMKGPNGTEAVAATRTKLPSSIIVVISGDEDPTLIRRCIQLGASGFIPKSSTQSVLISALRLVLAGGVYLPTPVLMAPSNGGAPTPAATRSRQELAGLTTRQVEVLRMAIRGKSNKVIAREMDLSEGTVKQHLSAAFRALQVSNRTEAVYRAAELGIRFETDVAQKAS